MLAGTREVTGHEILWGKAWDGSVASNVSLPPGLAWTQKTARHTWAGTLEVNLQHS